MTTFVLIVTFYVQGFGAISSMEFNSKEKCEVAGMSVLKNNPGFFKYACVEK